MGERHARVGAPGTRRIAADAKEERQRKARPERIRFTFRDDPAGGIPLDLRTQRHWFAGSIFAAFFAVFLAVALGMGARIGMHKVDDVFGLMMMLFDVFWVIGWSVGVVILGGLAFLFLFYRESARIQGGRLVHVPRMGPLKVVCEYDLAKIANLRLEPAKDGHAARVRFDYADGRARIGDAMAPGDAEAVMEKIRRAMPMSAPLGVRNPPHAGTGSEAGFLERKRAAQRPGDTPALPPPALSSPTTVALVVANMLPLAGVLVFGWDLGHVMALYWAESAIIGFYTVLKLCVVAKIAALVVVPFFAGHFGGFMAAHFALLWGFFIRGLGPADLGALEDLVEIFAPLWLALLALFISHGVSFAVNFIGRREYAGETIGTLMIAPYKRIFVMHLTIIFGGGLVMLLGTPLPALALLVVLKMLVDLRGHRREHAGAKE